MERVDPPVSFVTPVTKIKSIDMLNKFLESNTCKCYIDFLEAINESVVGKETDCEVVVSPVCVRTCSVSLTYLANRENVSVFCENLCLD
jgi:hypothetical protein